MLCPFRVILAMTSAPVGATLMRRLPVLTVSPNGIVMTAAPVAVTNKAPSMNQTMLVMGCAHCGALPVRETRMLPVVALFDALRLYVSTAAPLIVLETVRFAFIREAVFTTIPPDAVMFPVA